MIFTAQLRQHVVLASLVVAVLLLQLWSFHRRVPEVPPTRFEQHAVRLKTESHWIYGYFPGAHGAFLVKAKNPGRPLLSRASADSDLDRLMAVQLSTLPSRAALEGLFYLGVLIWSFLGAPRLAHWFARRKLFMNRRAAIAALLSAVTIILLLLPKEVAGYGASVFSNWTGPGAMSSSGPYLRMIGRNPAETVSYRTVAEAVLLVPTVVGRIGAPAVEWLLDTELSRVAVELLPSQRVEDLAWVVYYWSVVLGTYLVVGAILGKILPGWLAV